MSAPAPLKPEQLRRPCLGESLAFESTAELENLDEIIGQSRALEAVRFGIGIRREGYNLFVLGPAGTGKHTVIGQFLESAARDEPRPADWCYVNNFQHPHRPRALQLPAGQGPLLRDDMKQLVEDLRSAIPAAFESDEYRKRAQEIEGEFKRRRDEAFSKLSSEAEKHGVTVVHTPTGFAFAATKAGEVLSTKDYDELPKKERDEFEQVVQKLQENLQHLLYDMPRWHKASRDRLKELNREVTMYAIGHYMDDLKARYPGQDEVLAYLDNVRQDLVENVDEFRSQDEERPQPIGVPGPAATTLRRYEVNPLVDNGDGAGAPLVQEDNPSFQNLVGRAEHLSQMGTLITDFTMIRPGALHRANGGYLVLDAHKVLMAPYAWEGLKRSLSSGHIRIESLGEMLSIVSTVSLEPEPIPLSVKVVLVGDRTLYYLLQYYDPDFAELFKVVSDFDEEIERNGDSDLLYARLIATLARKEDLLHFDRSAVARVIEHSARLAGDADRLSTHMRSIADLLREADYWAREAGREQVTGADIQHTIDGQVRQRDRLREKLREAIDRGTLLIDVDGRKSAQVNGLSVLQIGDFAFGQPTRITATARLGDGKLIDIEREVELGGAIHTKGVLILASFLAARYARNQPTSFTASLVFEQSYGLVEGDSASLAELCALLSALADAPIDQSLAVTGSINQLGEVQAIGGVNEKVEGFYDVCALKGLNGRQGVIIPASNVRHLMLREDVVQAARDGRFAVYPVETVDQAASLLTGLAAGEEDADGVYPEDSLNGRVQARLAELTAVAQTYAAMGRIQFEDESEPAKPIPDLEDDEPPKKTR